MTRAKKQQIEQKKIACELKLNVTRNLGLEKHILSKPAMLTTIYHRKTVDERPKTFRTPANIPIGARGRKRQTRNILYLGISPNPDRRTITPQKPKTPNGKKSTQVALKPQAVIAGSSSGCTVPQQQVAKDSACQRGVLQKPLRTYARATSTPLPDRQKVNGSVVSPASPILVQTNDTDSQRIAIDFTTGKMGRLHISSSDLE